LYPNPVSKELKLHLTSNKNQDGTIYLIDALARRKLLLKRNFVVGEHEISFPTDELPNGIYLLNISLKDSQHLRKFIVKH
jgi:hypothetical protein